LLSRVSGKDDVEGGGGDQGVGAGGGDDSRTGAVEVVGSTVG